MALMPTLVLAIGLLVLLAVGSILSVQWVAGRSMVQEFASRLIARGLATQELALRRHLDAAVHQAGFVAGAIRASHYRFSDPALGDFVTGTIAAAPQISALILADRSGKALRVVRDAPDTAFQLDHLDINEDRQLADVAWKKGAAAIGSLDFDTVAPLSGSNFREINELARSFNAMLDGLRAFGR